MSRTAKPAKSGPARAGVAASAEMIGHLIARVQEREGWGAGVVPRLARDLQAEYALHDGKKPIGVAPWKTRRVDSLPKNLRGARPSVAQLERELADG